MLCILRDDLARAIKKLKSLGGGFAVIPVGKRRLVQCVPGELSMDHTTVLQKAEVLMYVCMYTCILIHTVRVLECCTNIVNGEPVYHEDCRRYQDSPLMVTYDRWSLCGGSLYTRDTHTSARTHAHTHTRTRVCVI